jgi:hypothetical protein
MSHEVDESPRLVRPHLASHIELNVVASPRRTERDIDELCRAFAKIAKAGRQPLLPRAGGRTWWSALICPGERHRVTAHRLGLTGRRTNAASSRELR